MMAINPPSFLISIHEGKAKVLAVKPIAHAMHGNNKLRVAWIGFNFLAQSENRDVDGACERRSLISPHLLEKRIARNNAATILDEVSQEAVFPFRKWHPRSIADHF